jgi:hypothetical protein
MPTNKPVLKTVEQFMADYKPTYQPLYPLFMGKSQQYVDDVGKINFKRAETVGDIRAKHYTPKDTEMRQIAVGEATKTFKKYYLANQFVLSHMQSAEGTDQVVAQVLDEHQKQFDEMFLTGEGSSDGSVTNNGLFWSGDDNHVTNSSVEIDSTDRLVDFHNDVITTCTQADLLSGQKLIIFYGSNIVPLFDSIYSTAAKPWKSVLQEVLGSNYSLAKMPASITPSGAHGWLIANLDQVKLHYTRLPSLEAQGSNEEKKYNWFNFLMGSSMLECLASGAVIKQPATLEA